MIVEKVKFAAAEMLAPHRFSSPPGRRSGADFRHLRNPQTDPIKEMLIHHLPD
jgi:hypothetical protein